MRLRMLVLALMIPGTALAHDFWIEPSTYQPSTGERIQIRLRVGADFLGDPVSRDPSAIVRFVAAQADRSDDVPGMSGRDPAGFVVARKPGAIVIAYESRGATVVHTKESLRRYMEEERLEVTKTPLQMRAGVRERFVRCAKTLVSSDGERRADWLIGMPLELVAETLPTHEEGDLVVRLYKEGSPGAGVAVTAISRRDATKRVWSETDDAGRARFSLEGPGPWLIKSVDLVEEEDGGNLTSHWATLTFE